MLPQCLLFVLNAAKRSVHYIIMSVNDVVK